MKDYEVWEGSDGWYVEFLNGTIDDPKPATLGPFESEEFAEGVAFRYGQHA